MKKLMLKKLVINASLFIAIAAVIWLGIKPMVNKDAEKQQVKQTLSEATVLQPTFPIPDFSLIDTKGKSFTAQSFKGHWTLLFFGYASCPDICPRALKTISEIYQAFTEQQYTSKPRFIFVSLDPTEDTPNKLSAFLARFNSEFMGLSGQEVEMNKLANACRVHSWTDPKLNAAGQKVIDHSAMLLLINPHGQLHAVFSPPHQPLNIVKDIQRLLNS